MLRPGPQGRLLGRVPRRRDPANWGCAVAWSDQVNQTGDGQACPGLVLASSWPCPGPGVRRSAALSLLSEAPPA